MKYPRSNLILTFFLVVMILSQSLNGQETERTVSFNRDIRPILAAKCYACHGPDEDHQEAGLRLDDRSVAIEMEAIVANEPEASGIVERIFSTELDSIMPPPQSGEALTVSQKELIKKWISEGAVYEKHWAFVAPVAETPPVVSNLEQVRNPIDNFVVAGLKSQSMTLGPEADAYTLVRRLYLDLTGLPPTIEEADAFVKSDDPNAYDKLVDQLLKSERYGERWAQPWLDLARYSDTNGYEKDRERSIWPYRDWVIRALNSDMPYDQFSVEQLAGDMLPSPTPQQLVATGFHRNTMLNEEGGIDPLEYRYLAMVDRVATTGTVWLGLTTGCAQCHTHKYDPISHTDYFSMMALLNNADEPDYLIPEVSRQQQIEKSEQRIAKLEQELERQFPLPDDTAPELSEKKTRELHLMLDRGKWINAMRKQVSVWSVIRPTGMTTNLPKLETLGDGSIFASGDTTKRDVYELTFEVDPGDNPIHAIRLEALPDDRLPDGGPGKTYYEGRKGDFFLSELSAVVDDEQIDFKGASHSYSKPEETNPKLKADNIFDGNGSSGWSPGSNKSQRLCMVMNLKKPITEKVELRIEMLFERHYTVSLGRFRFATTSNADAKANRLDEDVESILASIPKAKWSEAQLQKVRRAFLLSTPILKDIRKPLELAKKQLPKLNHSLVMQERPSDNIRPTHRHHRGEYLDPKEKVEPAIPAVLRSETDSTPANRLEFAKWIVSDKNPLAARVAVNRTWREFFGAGLMRTSGDFGVQSAPPEHPELLDWMAVQFQGDLKWSMKSLHRLIVTSATYRQSSQSSPESLKTDPLNIWLARGPSFRVSGEMVRDIALKSSTSLSTKMYGPGVRPPQPSSVTDLAYGGAKWNTSTGNDRFRRSIYTYKKRTAAFAAYTVFDSPTGESCIARRNRSNTPLQALTVLNDEMYQELARNLAASTIGKDLNDQDSIAIIFRSFLTRFPTDLEMAAFTGYFDSQLARLEAKQLSKEKVGGKDASNRQAALAMVARVVMNLDETITKR